jgi:hypothetical protein
MSKGSAVHLSVSWGYDVTVELRVSKLNWSKISKGESVTIRGSGYYVFRRAILTPRSKKPPGLSAVAAAVTA